MNSQEAIVNLPESEQRSLLDNRRAAIVLANAMKLEGAKVMGGDVLSGLARTGLRLDSVNQPCDRVGAGDAAQTRLAAIVETADCACGSTWVRLADATGPGAGWWHEGDEYDAEQGNDEDPGLYRKCYAGNRPPRRH